MKWHWNAVELANFWRLSPEEVALAKDARSLQNRCSQMVLLKFFQNEGRFPTALKEIPADILNYVAIQLDVNALEMASFDWAGRTARRQHLTVLSFLGIQRFGRIHGESLRQWLRTELLPLGLSLSQIQERTGDWFREHHLEPLSAISLERLIRSEVRVFESGLLDRIASSLSEDARMSLERLLQANGDEDPLVDNCA